MRKHPILENDSFILKYYPPTIRWIIPIFTLIGKMQKKNIAKLDHSLLSLKYLVAISHWV